MSNPQQEPTMEEILASIRKIISEDSNEDGQSGTDGATQAEAAAPDADDILELTEEIPEEPVPAPVIEAVAEPQGTVEFESFDAETTVSEAAPAVSELEPEPDAEPEPQTELQEEMPAPVSESGDIFSDKTRRALDEAFESIEPVAPPPQERAAPAPVPLEGKSIEALFDRAVRETFDPVLREWLGDSAEAIVERMKPVIREWMDEHFPAMLEEAVRGEVARVARSRRR